jgi:hypothetical protein
MKKYYGILLGIIILSIGLGALIINFNNLYYLYIYPSDPFDYIAHENALKPALREIPLSEQEQGDTGLQIGADSKQQRIYYEGRAIPQPQVGAPRGGGSERSRLHVSKKVSPKPEGVNGVKKRPKLKPAPVVEEKDVSTSAPVVLAKSALVSEPVVTASLTTKLIAYFDIEKILSWAANIITIVTGVLIILRRRKED